MTNRARPLLAHDAPNRFANDVALAREVKRYLKRMQNPERVTLLQETPEELATARRTKNTSNNVAAVLIESGLFGVEGFSVTPRGIAWTGAGRVPELARPYMYLSHLLRMDWRDVNLLFGPECVNDRLMFQWDPYPASAQALVVARLRYYVSRGGNPVTIL